jgi:hypothetical protein
LAILDQSAVSGVVRAVLQERGELTTVSDAVGIVAAFERDAPDVLVLQTLLPWAPADKLVSMVRRRWPRCRIVALGEVAEVDVDTAVSVDLEGLARLPRILDRLSSPDSMPPVIADAPFGVVIGRSGWRNDWLARALPGVRQVSDLLARSEDADALWERIEGGELTSFQVDDGGLLLDVVVVGDVGLVAPATGLGQRQHVDHGLSLRRVGHDLSQVLRTASYWIAKVGVEDNALVRATEILDRAKVLVQGMTSEVVLGGTSDLDSVLDGVEASLEAAIREGEARLEIRRPLGVVAMHPVLAERVLQNVVSNAVRHGGPGVKISVDATHCGSWVELSVVNHGLATTPPVERTGLGLAIVRDMVSQVGGDFEFAVGPNGATATLRLPVHEL